MVPGCPWRHPPKIYLQVLFSSIFLFLPFFFLFFFSFPLHFFFFRILNFCLLNFLLMKVIYPVGRKYGSAPSAPRLKLVSTYELKAFFSIEDVKLPPWSDGMYVIVSFWLHTMMCVDISCSQFFFSFIGAWLNIFPIWKNFLRSRSAAFPSSSDILELIVFTFMSSL